jgi:CRP-like cAMP-binding protein
MTDPETLSALTSHPFLQGLSPAHFHALADCAQRVTLTPGQFLGREHEPANHLYLIQAGRVAIESQTLDRGTVRIQTLGPGEIVGWSWLVPPHRWQFHACVNELVRAVALDALVLRERCEQDHELGYQLLKRLVAVVAQRLSATQQQLLDSLR